MVKRYSNPLGLHLPVGGLQPIIERTDRKLNYIYASDGSAPSLTLPHPGEGKDLRIFGFFEINSKNVGAGVKGTPSPGI
jgi:hypothetical protein